MRRARLRRRERLQAQPAALRVAVEFHEAYSRGFSPVHPGVASTRPEAFLSLPVAYALHFVALVAIDLDTSTVFRFHLQSFLQRRLHSEKHAQHRPDSVVHLEA